MALRVFNMWFTLLVIWLILNGSLILSLDMFTAEHAAKLKTDASVGAIICLSLSLLLMNYAKVFTDIRFSWHVIEYYFRYFGVFAQELARANIAVMRLVFKRRIEINPGIVEIKTSLQTPIGRMTLANSITLTPGTLVVDIRDDSLFVHWINVTDTDPQAATEAIAARFEKYLKVIYG